jgi:adenine-specific DNA-methyltransferase
MSDFSDCSITLTKKLTKETKRKEGIYFTPTSIVKKIVDYVFKIKDDISTVLEPSCGSGQFLDYLSNFSIKITGIEKNETIYKSLKTNKDVLCTDFLEHTFTTTYDLIIGNPPYFVMPKSTVDKKYYPFFDGRPNIYILFIVKSFELLNENGILAFVLPTNFLNCIYYNELRKYLKNYLIRDIYISKDNFLETAQETCTFIVQKTIKTNENFIVEFDDIILFKPPEDIKIIKSLKGITNLHKLGCTLSIGKIVWNQHKKDLTDDDTKTLLIYNGDFKNNVLEIQKYKDPLKKNYINKKGSTETALLVNRGYGTGKYTLNYCLVENKTYLAENHCIVINGDIKTLRLIMKSFENKKTDEFINVVFSNNAINIEEFLYVLPIYM